MKELVALSLSIERDCDDYVTYHMVRLKELGTGRAEIGELLVLTLIVGGSTMIPWLVRTAAFQEELEHDWDDPQTDQHVGGEDAVIEGQVGRVGP